MIKSLSANHAYLKTLYNYTNCYKANLQMYFS